MQVAISRWVASVALCVLLAISMADPREAAGAVPLMMNYQGFLTSGGSIPGDGAFPMTFRIYPDSTGGAPLWTESYATVAVVSGAFNVLLGSVNPLPAAAFDGSRLWLETEVDNTVMSPRRSLVSVPYSLHALSADVLGVPEQLPYVMSWVASGQVSVGPKFGATMRLTFNDELQRTHVGIRTFDFANGAADLGLDTGAEAASTWYYLYAVPSGASDFTLRASVAPPETGPTGFSIWKYLGAFRNGSSSDILWFYQAADRFMTGLQTEEDAAGPATVTTGPSSRVLSSFIPETSRTVILAASNWGLDARWEGYVDVGGSAGALIAWTHSGSGSTPTFDTTQGVEIPTPGTPKAYQRRWEGAGWRTVWVQGWRDGRVDLKAL